jgi:hypothetical protein
MKRAFVAGRGLCLLLFVLTYGRAHAQSISGKITDAKGEGLPYASVSLQNTTRGVVAGPDGTYRLLLDGPGTYTLVYKSLGYKPQTEVLAVGTDEIKKDVKLEDEELVLSEVVISGDGRDPAYAIMEKAIRNKKKNENATRAYSARAYSKAVGIDRKKKKIEYLSESFSTVWVQKPDQRKEIIHNSRVSGDSKQYSFIGAQFFNINPYKNLIGFGQVFTREFVSPVADNAFFFYEYKYLGNLKQKGVSIYKIEVRPKRPADPVFAGTIYIADQTYAVQGFDWHILGSQPIRFADSLRFKQEYTLVRDSLWMPTSNYVWGCAKINVLVQKFDVEGSLLNVYSDYDITDPAPPKGAPRPKPVIAPPPVAQTLKPGKDPKKTTDKAQRKLPEVKIPGDSATAKEKAKFFQEALKIEKTATAQNKNTTFWDSIRPAALSLREAKNFVEGDSTEKRKQTKAYVDSVNKATNKFKATDLLSGYTYTNTRNDNTFSIGSPLMAIQFNTMEGWNATLDITKRWNLADDRWFVLEGKARYGLSSARFFGQAGIRFSLNPIRRERLQVVLQDYVSEFSANGVPPIGLSGDAAMMQIDPLHNTLYTLLGTQNYLKLYRQQGGFARYYRRVYKDNYLDLFADGHRREPLFNTTDWTLRRNGDRQYTPNLFVPAHLAGRVGLRLHINFSNKYITSPDGLFYLTNPVLPRIIVEYAYGLQRNDSLRTAYHQLRIQIDGQIDMKLLGESRYFVRAGVFARNGELLLPDQFQVFGNQTIFRQNAITRFGVLDYYTYATQDRYAEQHYEHNFRGFIWNKLPLLRKLKLHEIAGIHSVQMPGLPAHTELLLGLTNFRFGRISLLRINYHQVLTGQTPGRQAVTFNFGLNL